MMPAPVNHPILDRIHLQLMVLYDITISELIAEPMFRDIARESDCITFTDDNGDWEIVVREIEGGRDSVLQSTAGALRDRHQPAPPEIGAAMRAAVEAFSEGGGQ